MKILYEGGNKNSKNNYYEIKMIYLMIISWLLFNSFYDLKKKEYFICFIMLFLSFSYEMGTDWVNYQDIYENHNFKDVEIGYVLLNILGKKLNLSYEIFMGILIFLSSFILLKIISKYSRNEYIYYFIILTKYLLVASFEPTIRQLLAVTIITLGYKKIDNKNFFQYCIYVFLAFLFHKSAIIGIIIYFIDNINLNMKKIISLFLLFPFIIKIIPMILQGLINFLPMFQRYSNYFQNIYYSKEISLNLYLNLYIIFTTILLLFFIQYYYDKYNFKKKYIKNMAILYIIIGFYLNKLPILYRVQEYFIIGLAIGLSYIGGRKYCYITRNKKINLKYLSIIILYIDISLYFFINFYSNPLNRLRYGEYKNYFIEIMKGDTKNNFYKKKEEYNKKIYPLIRENRKEREL